MLWLDQPQKYIEAFAQAGADLISIHVEPDYDVCDTLRKIKSLGKKAGIVLNPDTPVEQVFPYLPEVELVLFMTVFPGFGGQSFIGSVLGKVRDLAALRSEKGEEFLIEVDGGVGPEHAKIAWRLGWACSLRVPLTSVEKKIPGKPLPVRSKIDLPFGLYLDERSKDQGYDRHKFEQYVEGRPRTCPSEDLPRCHRQPLPCVCPILFRVWFP